MNKRELIDEIIYNRIHNGDSCVETAEGYMGAVREHDHLLYAAMVKLNEAAEEMIARLQNLNDELGLEYDDI